MRNLLIALALIVVGSSAAYAKKETDTCICKGSVSENSGASTMLDGGMTKGTVSARGVVEHLRDMRMIGDCLPRCNQSDVVQSYLQKAASKIAADTCSRKPGTYKWALVIVPEIEGSSHGARATKRDFNVKVEAGKPCNASTVAAVAQGS